MVGNMKGDNIMLNKEKYAKEILDILCQDGTIPAVVNNIPIKCTDALDCYDCKFYYNDDCINAFIKWVNSEYKEREIDWSKVPVDTLIYVWNNNDNGTYKRYFAEYDKINNMIIAFDNGGTSWNSITTTKWDNAKIKEGVDCSEWYKD